MSHSTPHKTPLVLVWFAWILCGLLVIYDTVEAGGPDFWTPLQSPTTRALRQMHFLDSLTGWIVGDGGTILHTTTGGADWQVQDSPVRTDIVDVFMLNAQSGWALAHDIGDTAYASIVLSTTDGGTNWDSTRYPVENEIFNSITFLNTDKGWMVGESGRVVGTINAGSSWVEATVESTLVPSWELFKVKFYSPTLGFATGGRFDVVGVVWRTTNGGATWTTQNVSPEPIYDIYFFDSLRIIGIGGDYDFGSGRISTTNGGDSWEYNPLGIWGQASAISFRTPIEAWSPQGFATTAMYSLDKGQTWTEVEIPGTNSLYDLQFTDSLHGYMIGANGAILKFNSNAVSVRERPDVPFAAKLYPAFPNPFNPTTTITYTLQARSYVSLALFDVSGKEVRELQSGTQDGGMHEVVFSAGDMASGMYVCRLRVKSENGTDVHSFATKLLLLK
ncbi:MAG: YCF48-related protein [Bacteroidota bacterium]